MLHLYNHQAKRLNILAFSVIVWPRLRVACGSSALGSDGRLLRALSALSSAGQPPARAAACATCQQVQQLAYVNRVRVPKLVTKLHDMSVSSTTQL